MPSFMPPASKNITNDTATHAPSGSGNAASLPIFTIRTTVFGISPRANTPPAVPLLEDRKKEEHLHIQTNWCHRCVFNNLPRQRRGREDRIISSVNIVEVASVPGSKDALSRICHADDNSPN